MLPAPPPRRRAVVRGLLTTAALAGLGACAPGPAASRAAAPTAPASSAPAGPTAAASPSPAALHALDLTAILDAIPPY